jgi:hypothetical protein
MKKVVIACLVLAGVLIGVSQIPAVKSILSQEKAVKEAIAAKLNVPVDSVIVDMNKAEIYDGHFLENLKAGNNEMKQTTIVVEEKSGKAFLILYQGGLDFTVEFAPGHEPAGL